MNKMATTERQSTLTLIDQIGQELIRRAAPIRFELAATDAERTAIYRLRYQVVVSQGWASPKMFPEGIERDEYDDQAIQIVGKNQATIIATARLVLPCADRPLPIETTFSINLEPRGAVVDCSRLLIVPRYRDPTHRVLWGLLGKIWMQVRAAGYTQVSGTFSEKILELYNQLGITIQILGDPQIVWGEPRYPCLVDVLASLPALQKQIETSH